MDNRQGGDGTMDSSLDGERNTRIYIGTRGKAKTRSQQLFLSATVSRCLLCRLSSREGEVEDEGGVAGKERLSGPNHANATANLLFLNTTKQKKIQGKTTPLDKVRKTCGRRVEDLERNPFTYIMVKKGVLTSTGQKRWCMTTSSGKAIEPPDWSDCPSR